MRGYDYGLVTILRDLDQMVPNAATEKALLILSLIFMNTNNIYIIKKRSLILRHLRILF